MTVGPLRQEKKDTARYIEIYDHTPKLGVFRLSLLESMRPGIFIEYIWSLLYSVIYKNCNLFHDNSL